MSRFSIAVDAETSQEFGELCGRLEVGDWQETFTITPVAAHPHPERSLEAAWHRELMRLVNGAAAVILPAQPGRAWVIYRERDDAFVQDQLFLVPDDDGEMMLDATTFAIRPRQTRDEDGNQISEWATSVEAIESFLKSRA